MPLGELEINSRFGLHKGDLTGEHSTTPTHKTLRETMSSFVFWLDQYLPDGREKDIALDRIEEAAMWAHKSIARRQPLVED